MFYPREKELSELKKFAQEPKAGFIFIRGRRRVGKSWVLEKFKEQNSEGKTLYITGKKDTNYEETIKYFARELDLFIEKSFGKQFFQYKLSELSKHSLNWEKIFTFVFEFLKLLNAAKNKRLKKTFVLILDEIQWLIHENCGFIGTIKEYWNRLENQGNIKILICGSSNKFFEENTGGEEKILRGIVTHADLWIEPIPLREVKRYFFPKWRYEQVALLYMIIGGIPYYLKQLKPGLGFIQSINDALFTSSSIFLQELDELLALDFNKTRKNNAKELIEAMPEYGTSLVNLAKKTTTSQSTLCQICEKLLDYKIIEQKGVFHKKQKGQPEKIFTIIDFFAAFYSCVLSKNVKLIKNNKYGKNIFGEKILGNNSNYYIENFTGSAFERLVKYILINFDGTELSDNSLNIFKKLRLTSPEYNIEAFYDANIQVDLIVKDKYNRKIIIIECKWGKEQKEWVSKLNSNNYDSIKGDYCLQKALVIGGSVSGSFKDMCSKNDIILIEIDDLF